MLGGISPEERQKVLADFEGAQQHLMFSIESELACWRQTPLVFCGIGHANNELAKAAVAFGLTQWEGLNDEEKAAAHVVTIEFCSDTRLRQEVREWLSGRRERHDLPVLLEMASRLMLIPTNEMSVERLRSITHSFLNKNHQHQWIICFIWPPRSRVHGRTLCRQRVDEASSHRLWTCVQLHQNMF